MLLQASEAAPSPFFLPIVILIIVGVIAGIVWWNTRCVNCQRPLARKKVKQSRSFGQFVTGKAHRHYQCKYCGHEWDKVEYIDA